MFYKKKVSVEKKNNLISGWLDWGRGTKRRPVVSTTVKDSFNK